MRHLACFAAFSLLVQGCYQSYTDPSVRLPDGAMGPVRDGGPVPVDDAGIVLPSDAGGPRPVDAGRPRPVDAGDPRPIDAGSGAVCEEGEIVPEYVGPGCGDMTLECLRGCEERGEPEDCFNDCVLSDPECVRCYNETVISCGNEVGCQPLWDEVACCTDEACPGSSPGLGRLECAADACFDLFDRYSQCLSERFGPCDMRLSLCFQG